MINLLKSILLAAFRPEDEKRRFFRSILLRFSVPEDDICYDNMKIVYRDHQREAVKAIIGTQGQLQSKASSIMTINSLMCIVCFQIENISEVRSVPLVFHGYAFLVLLVSIFSLLTIFNTTWDRNDDIIIDVHENLKNIVGLQVRRTMFFRISLCLTALATAGLAVEGAIIFFGIWEPVSGAPTG